MLADLTTNLQYSDQDYLNISLPFPIQYKEGGGKSLIWPSETVAKKVILSPIAISGSHTVLQGGGGGQFWQQKLAQKGRMGFSHSALT